MLLRDIEKSRIQERRIILSSSPDLCSTAPPQSIDRNVHANFYATLRRGISVFVYSVMSWSLSDLATKG